MKRFVVIAAVVGAALQARGSTHELAPGQQVVVAVPAATAAYSLDNNILDAQLQGRGEVLLTAHLPGRAHFVAIQDGIAVAHDVHVIGISAPAVRARREAITTVLGDTRFDSATSTWHNVLSAIQQGEATSTALRVVAAQQFVAGGKQRKLHHLSWSKRSAAQTVTVMDETLDVATMLAGGADLRGIHFTRNGWSAHAGITGPTRFAQTYVATGDRKALLLGYCHRLGRESSITHHVFWASPFDRSQKAFPLASLVYELERANGTRVVAEVVAGRQAAGSLEAQRRNDRGELLFRFRAQPSGVDGIGAHNLPGVFGDVHWMYRPSDRLTFDSSAALQRYTRLDHAFRVGSATARLKLTPRWQAHAGATYSALAAPAVAYESMAVPVGIAYDSDRFGASAEYRRSTGGATERRAEGGRLSLRFGTEAMQVHAFIDQQTQAPTLAFVFAQVPGLELALRQLGIEATTPEAIARAVSDYAGLIPLGALRDIELNVEPSRTQAGASFRHINPTTQLSLNFVAQRTKTVTGTNDVVATTATYARSVNRSMRVYLGWNAIAQRRDGDWTSRNSWQAGVSVVSNDLSFANPFHLKRRIVGRVEHNGQGVPNAIVKLDEARTVLTDARGQFVFPPLPRGKYRVTAQLTRDLAAKLFFTTASTKLVEPGQTIVFGVDALRPRVAGIVSSDEDVPLFNVRVNVSSITSAFTGVVTTDDTGRYSIDVPEAGRYEVRVAVDSVPAGYAPPRDATPVVVDTTHAARADVKIATIRSIGGRIFMNGGPGVSVDAARARVRLQELDREVVADDQGRFLFRGIPAGTCTIVAQLDGRSVTRVVTVPPGPAAIRNLDLVVVR